MQQQQLQQMVQQQHLLSEDVESSSCVYFKRFPGEGDMQVNSTCQSLTQSLVIVCAYRSFYGANPGKEECLSSHRLQPSACPLALSDTSFSF